MEYEKETGYHLQNAVASAACLYIATPSEQKQYLGEMEQSIIAADLASEDAGIDVSGVVSKIREFANTTIKKRDTIPQYDFKVLKSLEHFF